MPRGRFEKDLRMGSQIPLQPKGPDALSVGLQTRWHRELSAELIEGFVERYLHYKYDNPLPTPGFHREIWTACANSKLSHVLVLAPRGHAKSTSITEAYGLAALLFRQRDFALILSNTYGQSVEFLGDILMEFEENDQLRSDFQVHKILRGSEDNVVILMRDGHKIRIVAKGAEQKVRGVKWNKRRPNLILCDDLEDDEQILNPDRRKKFRNWFMRAVLPFGADDALFRVGATILHFDSLAQRLSLSLKERAALDKIDLNTEDSDDKVEEVDWFTLRYKAHEGINDFSNILWPEKFPEIRLRRIKRKYVAEGDLDGYSQEYLNIPIAEGDGFFRKSDLLPMEKEDFSRPMRKYACWDYAISKNQGADYTVGVVFGVDDKGGLYVLDVRRGRWDGKEIIDEMFMVQKAHKCLTHYAEAGALEKAIGPFLYDEMHRRAKEGDEDAFFSVDPVRPDKDKVTRATSFRARTRAHSVKYDHGAEWWPALLQEMERFPKGEHDDQVDPQSLMGSMLDQLIHGPSKEELQEEELITRFGSRAERATGRSVITGY